MALTPADPGHLVGKLLDQINSLESRVDRLERAHRMNAQRATVASYVGGSTTVVVSFVATGTTASVGFIWGYWTPAPGHTCVVFDYGGVPLAVPVTAY